MDTSWDFSWDFSRDIVDGIPSGVIKRGKLGDPLPRWITGRS